MITEKKRFFSFLTAGLPISMKTILTSLDGERSVYLHSVGEKASAE